MKETILSFGAALLGPCKYSSLYQTGKLNGFYGLTAE